MAVSRASAPGVGRIGQQDTIRRPFPAPNPPSKLVQLRQPKPLRPIDHHHRRHWAHRCPPRSPSSRPEHRSAPHGTRHIACSFPSVAICPCNSGQPQTRQAVPCSERFILPHHRFCIRRSLIINPRNHNIRLPPGSHLLTNKLPRIRPTASAAASVVSIGCLPGGNSSIAVTSKSAK